MLKFAPLLGLVSTTVASNSKQAQTRGLCNCKIRSRPRAKSQYRGSSARSDTACWLCNNQQRLTCTTFPQDHMQVSRCANRAREVVLGRHLQQAVLQGPQTQTRLFAGHSLSNGTVPAVLNLPSAFTSRGAHTPRNITGVIFAALLVSKGLRCSSSSVDAFPLQ